MSNDFDKRFLSIAYEEALRNSTDPSTQNGAILVRDNKIIAKGANHFPFGVKETAQRWERPLKYSYVEHAERNCLYNATRNGINTVNTTMYCPWFACADCARAIIQCGITEVVGHNTPSHGEHTSWLSSIKVALEMFDEAGVKYRWLNDKLGFQIRINGKTVEV